MDYGGLQGFLPGQSSSLRSVEQLVDIPVLGGVKRARVGGSLLGFSPGQAPTAFSGAADKVGSFVTASRKIVAEKSVAKVAEHSEAVSVAAKAGKFKIASRPASVPEKAGTFKAASQKTEVSSPAHPHDFHPGQGSTAPRGSDSLVGVQSLVPEQCLQALLGEPLGWTGVRLW